MTVLLRITLIDIEEPERRRLRVYSRPQRIAEVLPDQVIYVTTDRSLELVTQTSDRDTEITTDRWIEILDQD